MAPARRRHATLTRSFPILLALGAALLLACGGDDAQPRRPAGEGEPRPFRMGLSALPAEPGDDAYREAFRLAGEAGEVVLIQRPPPWSEFLPGSTISGRTERLTRFEKDLAREYGLRLLFAIDPTEPADRGRLAALPDELRGKDFGDQRLREAFIAYAKYVALNYKPAYLALGVEVDMFFRRRGDGAFRNFLSLYFEAYDAAKEVSPDTLVFPTFQFENMLGILQSEPSLPAWSLVNRFEPKIDMLAVSSFPGFVRAKVSDLPSDYYAALKGRSQRPIAFFSVGWSSAPRPGDLGREAEGEQLAYILKALAAAEELDARLFVWYLGRDPRVSPAPSFAPLAMTGLQDADGGTKAAWHVWRQHALRPPPAEP